MTFEELEADWEVWKIAECRSKEFTEVIKRSPPIDNTTFPDGDDCIAIINGCILLTYTLEDNER